MYTIRYDQALCATPPDSTNWHVLLSAIEVAVSMTGLGGTVTPSAVGEEIKVDYPSEPTAPQLAAALAVIVAFDGAGGDIKQDETIIVEPYTMTPNPGSNVWTDVEGATFEVAEDRRVTGTADVHASVGATSEPCGQPIHFTATRRPGQSVKVSASSDGAHGAVNGFRVALVVVPPGTVKLTVQRRQTPAIKIDATITRSTVLI